MYELLLIIAIIVCVLLVLIVLIQNPKGGGLASNFSSSSQLMGVQKTGDFLEKGTWGLAIFLMVLSLAINISVKGGSQKSGNIHQEQIDNSSKPQGGASGTSPFSPATPQPVTTKKTK
jgi:preprotein translocase subunit SecG